MKCVQCSNEATTTALIIGFEMNGQTKTTTINNRCWPCTSKINDATKRIYNDNIQVAREERERKEKETKNKERERAEQARKKKEREKNKTCCRVCGNSSWFEHLVIDTRNKKVENKSTSYQVNPDYEIIVCNKDCLKKWYDKTFSFTCPQCSKVGTDSIVKNGKRFCSSKCVNNYYAKYNFVCAECQVEQEHVEIWTMSGSENQNKKFCSKHCSNQHQLPKCDDCGNKCYSSSYYKDVDNKTGNLCINCHIIQKNKKSKPSDPIIPESEPKKTTIPQQTSPVVKSDEIDSSSHSPSQSNGNHVNDNDSNTNSPISDNLPSSTPLSDSDSSTNSPSTLCPLCQKKLYSEAEYNNHFQTSPNCKKIKAIMEPIAEKIKNNESILDVDVDSIGLNEEMTIALKTVQRIQRGEKVDISQLNISEQAKAQLRKVKSLKNYRNEREDFGSEKEEIKKTFYQQTWVIIGVVAIILVSLIVMIRNSRVKKIKRK